MKFIGAVGPTSARFAPGTVELAMAGETLRFRFANANAAAEIDGEELLPGRSFYYAGNDPSRWQKNVPNFARIRYRDLYPGIDCIFYGTTTRQMEYDLIFAPHADPTQVVLEIDGARRLAVTPQGDLSIETPGLRLLQKKPKIFQAGREIAGRYQVEGKRVRVVLAAYDTSQPLRIDPVLAYASYFGGTGSESANAIVSDSSGNFYVTGQTNSPNFPPALFSGNVNHGGTDVFLTKFDPTGTAVLFSVFLGSSAADTARSIAVDAAGNVYIVGQTQGTNFPVLNAFQASAPNGARGPNGFVAKLNASGNLLFSTYLGGNVSPILPQGLNNFTTAIQTIAPDNQGNVWVGGWTFTTDFPSDLGPALDPTNYPYTFVTGFNSNGGLLHSMTFNHAYNNPTGQVDGAVAGLVTAIALDSSGNIVIAANSAGGSPVSAAAAQPTYGGGDADVFVAKVNPNATSASYLLAATYLGGAGIDVANGLALDPAGNIYLAGSTTSTSFPVSSGALESNLQGPSGAFFAKLNSSLSQIEYATYFGGANGSLTTPRAVSLDPSGDIFIAGYTDYADLTPASLGSNSAAPQPQYAGNIDGFVLELSPAEQPLYFTYYGGAAADYIFGMTLDAAGNLYAAGMTNSSNLPTVTPAFQPAPSTPPDGFFLRLNFASPNAIAIGSVNVAGLGSAAIAQNTWVEIHGVNLAPAGTAAIWSTASSFNQGEMPTELSGVSVQVNGKPAFIYYVSATQVNVLTPLDPTLGPVPIVLTSGSAQSSAFTASLQTVSPSFLLFGATRYIAATHTDYALLGPASLSTPGYSFTPAKPGETIVLYGVGFGLPAPPAQLVGGSSNQSGSLPVAPAIQIGNLPAMVTFYGVVSPGLYQFNVVVPAGAANGDVTVQATFGGLTTPIGDLIAVHN
ncbi:MAG TPA: SBBP repeat-containing protein [Bryobacteraceae bacterium]|nr:SBBP repeat-containing protein [Bryobacteraceae bacterium]